MLVYYHLPKFSPLSLSPLPRPLPLTLSLTLFTPTLEAKLKTLGGSARKAFVFSGLCLRNNINIKQKEKNK
jgi:hypothetical protein